MTALVGPTVFVGDSITVGLSRFVDVAGERIEVAKGGASSGAILALLRAADAKGTLARARNLVVLAGTNDIGGGLTPEQIFGNITAIWKLGKGRGLHVYALTVPPAVGAISVDPGPPRRTFPTWRGQDGAVDAKRRAVNAMVAASVLPDRVIDLDGVIGDPAAPGHLARAFDGGDHLHPRPDAFGRALGPLLGEPLASSASRPGPWIAFGLGVATCGVVAWLALR